MLYLIRLLRQTSPYKLMGRGDNFRIIIEPMGESEIERLIAKIHYEFMYFIEGRFIFYNAADLQPIFDLIDKGSPSEAFYFARQEPKFKNPIATHLIRFIFRNTNQQLYISFLGILDFLFMTFFIIQTFGITLKKS